MKIKLFSAGALACELVGNDIPKNCNPRLAVNKILEHWREGDWLWVNNDTKAIRFDSITSVEIVDENAAQDLND
jgi:hypothetical protein